MMLKKKARKEKSIILFEDIPIRRVWVEKEEKWYFAIMDVIKILTESPRPRKYWNALKSKLKAEGSELSQKMGQLKLTAKDGKKYLTDVADTETIFRIIQSIPSPKAEPFKLWLARVGYERLQETVDPELSVNRARKNWKSVGRSQKWIEQRMRGQEIRNKLTDYWSENDVKEELEYAKLTDVIHKEWTGLTTSRHKKIKSLKRENLRDNMTEAELIFTALAELSTTNVAKKDKAIGYKKN
ncbi:Bro-N domain-containing protein, partial [bacterium]|nr:Bro-N domain-containing protein [bacterium]